MNNTDEISLICFALKEYGQVGPKLFQQILITYGYPGNIFGQPPEDISAMTGINMERAQKAVETQYELDKARDQLNHLDTINISVLSYFDEEYPQAFRALDDPPVSIYLKGESQILHNGGVAIVGTTSADHEGIRMAVDFSKRVTAAGKTVISGLAAGIDTAAHLGCIQNGGKTVAVLGCGHLNVYPEENIPLARMISETGAVVSEYDIYADPIPGRLVSRNRLIAALAEVVVVAQIGEKSKGELYAANAAIVQGKPVFVIDPDNRYSQCELIDSSFIKIKGIEQFDEILDYIVR
jgi:DNA processing protein